MALVDFYQFVNEKSAVDAAKAVDAGEKYPKAGIDVGDGIHIKPPFVTQRYSDVIKISAIEYVYLKTTDSEKYLKDLVVPIVKKDYETDIGAATKIIY
jgi:hypothetical protein